MIVIIDYGMSNLRSVAKAVETVCTSRVIVSSNPEDLSAATHIILPGQGAYPQGIANLKKFGFYSKLIYQVTVAKKPFLGICLGLQLLSDVGMENGNNQGLGIISGKTVRLDSDEHKFKLPHIGWDDITLDIHCPLFIDIPQYSDFYFVHSYYLLPKNSKHTVATCTYGQIFPAVLWDKNIFATLFHPEKSQKNGLKLLQNFLNYSTS